MEDAILLDVEPAKGGLLGKIIKLLLLALVIAAVVAAVKMVMGGKSQESFVPDEVRDAYVDKVETAEAAVEEAVEAAEDASDEVAEGD